MTARREWPEAPNVYVAVTSTLPTLCAVLAAFVSGYFAAVVVSDAKTLSEHYVLAPLIYPDWVVFVVPIERRIAISVVCVAALAVMLGSIVYSIAALMLKYDPSNYEGAANPPPTVLVSWKEKRESATSRALILFQFSLPLMMFSLALILNGWLLTVLVYLVSLWLMYVAYSVIHELRSR
jgi:hypothetical protein